MYSYSLPDLEPVCYSFPVLTVASWPAYRFLRRQVRWSGIPICFRIFQFVVIHTVKGFGVVSKAEVDIFQEDLKTTPYMMCTEWSVRNRRLEGYCQTPFKFSPRHIKKRKIRLPWCLSGKESACQYRRHKFNPWSRKSHMPRNNKAGIFILLQSNKAITTEPVL